MYCILLEFRPLPGQEAAFAEAWEALTRHIFQQHGSKGSRLHRSQEGKWIAYAQWPSKAVYDSVAGTPKGEHLREDMMATLEPDGIQVLDRLEVVRDLLER